MPSILILRYLHTHTIHGATKFTYIYHRKYTNQPFMKVNIAVPWILWDIFHTVRGSFWSRKSTTKSCWSKAIGLAGPRNIGLVLDWKCLEITKDLLNKWLFRVPGACVCIVYIFYMSWKNISACICFYSYFLICCMANVTPYPRPKNTQRFPKQRRRLGIVESTSLVWRTKLKCACSTSNCGEFGSTSGKVDPGGSRHWESFKKI